MKSNLGIAELLDDSIHHNIYTVHTDVGAVSQYLNHYDCQDTDDDNSTECYFYFPNDISKPQLDLVVRKLAEILGVPVDSAKIEDQTEEGNPEIRVAFVVEICNSKGEKFK